MKRNLMAAALALCVLICSECSSANDPWPEYQKHLQNYYFLSEQPFEVIECRVVLPDFEKAINEQAKRMKESTNGGAELKSNLSDFTLMYSKAGGLSFNEPKIELIVTSEEGIKDRQKFETGKQLLTNGFNQAVQGAVQTISSIFNDYIKPDRSRITLTYAKVSGDKSEAKYTQDGMQIMEVCEKKHCTISGKSAQGEVHGEQDYENVGDKLILKSLTATIKQPDSEIHVKTDITYQKIKDITFPASITSAVKMQGSDSNMEGSFVILLQDVRVR